MRLFPRENYHPREHRLPLRSRAGLQLLLVVSEPGDLAPVLQVRVVRRRRPGGLEPRSARGLGRVLGEELRLRLLQLGHVPLVVGEKSPRRFHVANARQAQLVGNALIGSLGADLLDLGRKLLCGLLGRRRLGHLRLQLRDLLVALGQRRLVAVVGYLLFRRRLFLSLRLLDALRLRLLEPLLDRALLARAIALTTHDEYRLSPRAGKRKARNE